MLKKSSFIILMFCCFSLWAKKKPQTLQTTKSLAASQIISHQFNETTDSLLVSLVEVDSLSDTDQKWEIIYSQSKWKQTMYVWGGEKQVVTDKFLFFFPKTKFNYNPFLSVHSLGSEIPVSNFLKQLDSIVQQMPHYSEQLAFASNHYYIFQYISPQKHFLYAIPVSENLLANAPIYQIIRLFQNSFFQLKNE